MQPTIRLRAHTRQCPGFSRVASSLRRACAREDTMTTTVEQGWWTELDDEVLACLRDGPQSTHELAERLNLSPAGATSVLLMLAAEGKIRVTAVELAETA
jgi:predicted ArsR family transcriptional regulator